MQKWLIIFFSEIFDAISEDVVRKHYYLSLFQSKNYGSPTRVTRLKGYKLHQT